MGDDAFEHSDAQFRVIVETLSDAIVIVDQNGVLRLVNPAAEALFDRSRDELVGTVFDFPLVVGETAEIDIHCSNRGVRVAEMRVDDMMWNGESVRLASLRDVTERKKREREAVAGLEQRIADGAAQLDAANQELDSFSYSISHDLRAPLRAISGLTSIVVEDYGSALPEEGQYYLARINLSAGRMEQMMEDLLTFSRISRKPLSTRPVALNELVQGIIEELTVGRDDNRQVSWVVDDLPPCEGDPTLVKYVFSNLLSNALKFTGKRDSAHIEVGFHEMDSETVYYVRDNGAGFDMQYANKLFKIFQRMHSADEFDGDGAGLAIAARIVSRHGGRIWPEAEVDKGATFYFTLAAS